MTLCPGRSALAEDMGELPAAEVVRLGGEMKDTALVPVRGLQSVYHQQRRNAEHYVLSITSQCQATYTGFRYCWCPCRLTLRRRCCLPTSTATWCTSHPRPSNPSRSSLHPGTRSIPFRLQLRATCKPPSSCAYAATLFLLQPRELSCFFSRPVVYGQICFTHLTTEPTHTHC